MATDRNHLSEEELNRQRKAEQQDDDGIIDTVGRAFESAINPIVTATEPDEENLEERRDLNDEATRESSDTNL